MMMMMMMMMRMRMWKVMGMWIVDHENHGNEESRLEVDDDNYYQQLMSG